MESLPSRATPITINHGLYRPFSSTQMASMPMKTIHYLAQNSLGFPMQEPTKAALAL